MHNSKPLTILTLGLIVAAGPVHAQDMKGMVMPMGMTMSNDIPTAPVVVRLDSARHAVVITSGPYHLPPMDVEGMEMAAMMDPNLSGHEAHNEHLLVKFPWPQTSWMRGFKLEIMDKTGRLLPQKTMHHMVVMNLDRRQLVYPLAERVLGIGEETAGIRVPRSVGLPLEKGQELAVYIMWNNDTGHDLDGVQLRFTLINSPINMTPRPTAILPFNVDVNSHPGLPDAYDVPNGGLTKSSIFTVPVSGRLLGIGGHMHDHGVEMRIEDVASGKVLAKVHALRDAAGHVHGVSRQLLGVKGRGPHLRVGRSYRLVVVYENHTGKPLMGVMGLIAGLYAPDDVRDWPTLDKTHPEYLRDIAMLPFSGEMGMSAKPLWLGDLGLDRLGLPR